ncbi:MAG: lipopolysaccharide heptosyltransferase II [FCB group bacterium]|jgi:heptosyltransferase-2|nr:lipopolysaccharide heptosyltransferase II [FCB group bacterium]
MVEARGRVLALAPNWVGDVVMCTPALRALHKAFPDAELTVAGRASACALLQGLPWISHCVTLAQRPRPAEMLSAGRRLRSHGTDLAVVFPHSFRAALQAWLAGATRRVGYARGGRSFLLTDPVEPHREDGRITPIYMGREYLDLLKPLGIEDDGLGLELAADPAAVRRAREALGGSGPRVGFSPGAAFGPSKLWPAERYAAVADALAERVDARCVILTGPGEEDTRRAVLAAARTPFIDCDGGKPSLETLKATVSQLDLLVCNDSGARHVAVAFGVPTLCLMGPTSPLYSEGPYERGRVLRIDVDCGPCQKPVCSTDHRCMTGISVDWAVETALEILEEKNKKQETRNKKA